MFRCENQGPQNESILLRSCRTVEGALIRANAPRVQQKQKKIVSPSPETHQAKDSACGDGDAG
jgi:hypothetical protein